MTNLVYIHGDSTARVWGLSGRERLLRMIAHGRGATVITDVAQAPAIATVLIVRGDYLFDPRLLQALLRGTDAIALATEDGAACAAVRIDGARAARALAGLDQPGSGRTIEGVPARQAGDLVEAHDRRLLKYDPARVMAIDEAHRRELEAEIFGGSYKGVTDFITKFLWPKPALVATRACVALGLQPNHVTLIGLGFAVVAGVAFWCGALGAGLVAGWIMTFLDTVDGKLARVTITSSRFGDRLDHGVDLIHPPLWYLAWGAGIADHWTAPVSTTTVFWLILVAYVFGRLCEGAFKLWVAPFKIFLWRPIDSFNRLITARRNPNLVLLTLSWLAARPDVGLWAVLVWHACSTLFLWSRCLLGLRIKRGGGEVTPWLESIDPIADRHHFAVRVFSRLPTAAAGP